MAKREWVAIQSCFCHHLGQEVALEAEVVYPADFLPDQSPRIMAHRCSHSGLCNQEERPACIWAGTNPAVDPFSENLLRL